MIASTLCSVLCRTELPNWRGKDGNFEVNEKVPSYEPTASDVVSPEKLIVQTSWTGATKACIKMLGEATSSLLKPQKRVANSVFEVSLESG